MLKIRTIFILLVSILLLATNVNAAAPKKVAIFVNGFMDCCAASPMESLKGTLSSIGVNYTDDGDDTNDDLFITPWNSLFPISGATSQDEAGIITVGATQNFVDQMKQYFSSLPDNSEVYLFGHSFGGDSVLQFLEQYKRTRIKIRLVALIEPVKFNKILAPISPVGLRPTGHTISDNVQYFFNRWQRNDLPPTDFQNSGRIPCNAASCDQKESSKARSANGNTIYIPCRWFEITCPGYSPPIPFITNGSLGRKQQRLHHGTFQSVTLNQGKHGKPITSDEYIVEQLIQAIKKINGEPPIPSLPKVKLCNKSSEDLSYATTAYDVDLQEWVVKGWSSIDALECVTEEFDRTGEAFFYATNRSGLEWPIEQSLAGYFMCASRRNFQFLEKNKTSECKKPGTFYVRGARAKLEFDVVTTVNIEPKRLNYTLTVKNIRTDLGFGRVTSLPANIDCGGAGDCSAIFNGGHLAGTVVLEATPNDGSNFAGWRGCTIVVGNRCEIVMTQDKVVEAHFTSRPVLAIDKRGTGFGKVVSDSGDINCGSDCFEEYQEGDNFVTLTTVPAEGSLFTGWFGFQANDCPETGSCELNVDSFNYLIAQFDRAPTDFILNVSKEGNGSGVVFTSKAVGIDCGKDCSEEYTKNTQVELIATADSGSLFQGWNGACTGKSNCLVKMYNNKDIRATFAIANPRTFTVNNLNDTGAGSLRQAILDANENPGDDTIVFVDGLSETIVLTSGQLEITDSLVIEGSGADVLSVSGNNSSRIFKIISGTVVINGLTLKDGHDTTGNGGGAIITENGTITINACAIINNVSDSGGGGGGIRKFGPGVVTIINSLISGNSALDEFQQGDGGGIRNDKEKLTLINSTVSNNAAASGGGVTSNNGVLEINNSTITENSATNFGGGIDGNSEIELANSIVSGNIAPSENEISFFSVDGHIFLSKGHNILGENGISGVSSEVILASTDLILADSVTTLIKPLANNGGTTLTHLPVERGNAIDAGDKSLIPQGIINDQRGDGFPRINNDALDIGAVESVNDITNDELQDFRFIYNSHTYDVITTPASWKKASKEAGLKTLQGRTGYLVHINDAAENQKIIDELTGHFSKSDLTHTLAFDGGLNLEALWIGASDISDEGTWLWQDDNVQFWQGADSGKKVNGRFTHWGKGETGSEPNNYTGDDPSGQNVGAIRLTDWVFGKLGEWDDVSANNSLFYIVEYDEIERETKTPFYKNGILFLPSVFVADGNGCFHLYSARLALVPESNPLSFSLTEAQLLSALTCDINVNNSPLFNNGVLELPNVDVFDGFNNSSSYEAELSLIPLSDPLEFKLLKAQKL